ncbi:MAG: PIN domain-containing protein [Pirellula sp.]
MTAIHVNVIVDTGPLVAILDRSDEHHAMCLETLKTVLPPMWTSWPVLTEVAWLLRDHPKGLQRLWTLVETGFMRIADLPESCLAEIPQIQKRFPTLKLQLADMTLILIAELNERNTIFTLDRRDFAVIQKKSRRKLRLLPESLG